MNRYIKLVCIFIVLVFSNDLSAQFSLTNGSDVVDIGFYFSTFYNKRFLHDTSTSIEKDFKKDRFELGNARLSFEGRHKNDYEYELGLDFSKLGYTNDLGETPAILNAHFSYKKLNFINIKVGYQKLPYSRSSLTPLAYSPYWQRGEIARGNVFSRRDVGVLLYKDFWQQRVNIDVGLFTGQGENILTSVTGGDNDASGKYEFAGRIDFAYPVRYRYRDVYDTRHVPIPMFAVGANYRYVERKESIKGIADYDLKIVAGYRTLAGIDFAAQYKGFSCMLETHYLKLTPNDTGLLQAKPTNYFRAGGTILQLNYFSKKLKSGFSIRYDDFIPNDLVKNNTEKTVSFGYNYMLNGFKSMIRIQYWYRMVDRFNPLLLRTDDQLRVGWQYSF